MVSSTLTSYELGIAAALIAPLVMTIGFYIWENHWTGSAFALNMFKCNFASIGFLIVTLATPTPTTMSVGTVNSTNYTETTSEVVENNYGKQQEQQQHDENVVIGYMILSSTIGILIGDVLWLHALQLLGAKHVIVLDCLKPFVAVLFGWLVLHETLHNAVFGGIILTLLGVVLVSYENLDNATATNDNNTEQQQQEVEYKKEENETATTAATAISRSVLLTPVSTTKVALEQHTKHSQLRDFVVDIGGSRVCMEDDRKTKTLTKVTNHNEESVPTKDEKVEEIQMRQTLRSVSDYQLDDNLAAYPNTKGQKENSNDNKNQTKKKNKQQIWIGIYCSIGNIVLDTYGALLIKQYGKNTMSIWKINLIRFGYAGIVMILISITCIIYYQFSSSRNIDHHKSGDDDDDDDYCVVKPNMNSQDDCKMNKTNKSNHDRLDPGGSIQSFHPSLSSSATTTTSAPLVQTTGSMIQLLSIYRTTDGIRNPQGDSNKINNNSNGQNKNSIDSSSCIATDTMIVSSATTTTIVSNNHTEAKRTCSNSATTTSTTTAAVPAAAAAVSVSSSWYTIPIRSMSRASWYRVIGGTILVTFVTPTISNYALFHVALALAITLGSTGPLYSLFISYYFFQQTQPQEGTTNQRKRVLPTIQSVIGTILSIAGIVVLAWKGS